MPAGFIEGVAAEIFDELKDAWNEDFYDRCIEEVDCYWSRINVDLQVKANEYGSFNVSALTNVVEILEYCEGNGCIETDYGLWEGLAPVSALGVQAFFSLAGVLYSAVILLCEAWEKGHDCDECKGGKCGECKYNLLWEYRELFEDEDDG